MKKKYFFPNSNRVAPRYLIANNFVVSATNVRACRWGRPSAATPGPRIKRCRGHDPAYRPPRSSPPLEPEVALRSKPHLQLRGQYTSGYQSIQNFRWKLRSRNCSKVQRKNDRRLTTTSLCPRCSCVCCPTFTSGKQNIW